MRGRKLAALGLLFSGLAGQSKLDDHKCGTVESSNGNDIETKRNDASITGVFSIPKRKEPSYSKTWTDRSEANTIINILCRIEEITNIISPEFVGSKRKRI